MNRNPDENNSNRRQRLTNKQQLKAVAVNEDTQYLVISVGSRLQALILTVKDPRLQTVLICKISFSSYLYKYFVSK